MEITNKIYYSNKKVFVEGASIKLGKVKNNFNIDGYTWLKFKEPNRILKTIDSIDEYLFFLHYVSDEELTSIALHESNVNGIDVFACTSSSKIIFYCIKNAEEKESLLSMVEIMCELIENRNESSDDLVVDAYNVLIEDECTRIRKILDAISFTNFLL